MKVHTFGEKCEKSVTIQLVYKKITDLHNRTDQRLRSTDEIISRLKSEGIEIIKSRKKRQTVVVWIWCRSQTAIEHIQKLHELNHLQYAFFENSQRSIQTTMNIDRIQFKKTAGKYNEFEKHK